MRKRKKDEEQDDFLYSAIMDHGYAQSGEMRRRMTSVGLSYEKLQLKPFCLTHSALWDDPIIQSRMRTLLDAMPFEFSAAQFLELPFESGYWRNAVKDGHAFEVFDQVVSEMSDAEKIELRGRVLKAVKL